jgi:N-methylhydantoinase A
MSPVDPPPTIRRLPSPAPLRIGVDTGGTFTDFIAVRGERLLSFKVPSTPRSPSAAILAGLARILTELAGEQTPLEIVHGTTVATNALLERTGARTALVTTAGFEDLIEIGRQARPDLYNLAVERPAPLIPRALRFGVRERVGADAGVLERLDPVEVSALAGKLKRLGVESVAISLLFSFAHPAHERAVAEALAALDIPISVSHQILPEYREYERTSTVVINAYLAPRVGRYLSELSDGLARLGSANESRQGEALADLRRSRPANHLARRSRPSRLRIMQSSGGSISAEVAAREPVRTILSGPAGGVVAATRMAELVGMSEILTFDMGGTSTDVALCRGPAGTTNEAQIAGLPVAVPVLDIHTVGAGGGSIASVDAGGALRVGPESAGADPGPACYGVGTRPTVTDANLALGRFAGRGLLSGQMPLDEARAAATLAELAANMSRASGRRVTLHEAALGVIGVANANMERALRLVSVERGHDPRRFTLVSFGGAGGLHAAALASALRIPQILIPAYPGAFSALGLLLAEVVKDYSRTVMLTVDADGRLPPKIRQQFAALEREAARDLRAEGFPSARMRLLRSLALRYRGQSFELEVAWSGDALASFHQAHRERYGHADPSRTVEVVSVRLRGVGMTEKPALRRERLRRRPARAQSLAAVRLGRKLMRIPVYDRESLPAGAVLASPSVVIEYGSTTLIPPGWQAVVDHYYNLILTAVGNQP